MRMTPWNCIIYALNLGKVNSHLDLRERKKKGRKEGSSEGSREGGGELIFKYLGH